jgi:3-oxoadipate enol-lactonase / 4-carboxymuconolactone decarboxylase
MPFATRDDVRLYWRAEGEAGRPALLLLHSIGSDLGSWDAALPYLTPAFRVIRMDARGHGASDASPGEYSLATLAADAQAVLDAAGVERAVVCGVSLGGMVAQQLAIQAPGRVGALVAAFTSARLDPETWNARIAAVRAGGMEAIADAALGRFFTPDFARTHPAAAASARATLVATSPDGYVGCGAAIRDMDLLADLARITAPTLVIGGEQDVSTPFADHGRRIAEGVAGARVVLLDTAHLGQIESPAAVAGALRRFVAEQGEGAAIVQAAEALYEDGLKVRRRVLGDAWVDASLARRTPFTAEFQAMITRVAWQGVWGRPGLDVRTRRLLVLSVTAALGRWEEFRMHVRVGLEQGGFTEDELKETLMQLALYAGLPAANTAFAEASELLREHKANAGT